MAKHHFKFCMILLFSLFFVNSGDAQNLHRKDKDLPCVNKNYNVITHIAVDSTNRAPIWDEFQVDSIVEAVTKYFDPICMSFSMCEYNIMETDYTLGNIRTTPLNLEERYLELERKFSEIHKINVFFLDTIQEKFCGDARFFGIMSQDSANIFLERDCLDGPSEQLAHQLGHLFGLRDTYHPTEVEMVDGSNCEDVADRLCDTPADPYGQIYLNEQDSIAFANGVLKDTDRFSYLNQCEFIHLLTDPNGEYYQPDVGNIMSAYPCKCGFTREQYLMIVDSYNKVYPKHF